LAAIGTNKATFIITKNRSRSKRDSSDAEDPPKRWQPLNHTVAVNTLLGYSHRVAMTNRPTHAPTEESNAQIYAFFEYGLKPSLP
jgi:hypothetical protein